MFDGGLDHDDDAGLVGFLPQWCERHHIIERVDGGTTDLDDLTLLCRHHHHNYASRGWRCRLNTDRLPEWPPPRWIDPHQHPIINSRIIAHLRSRRRRHRRHPDTGTTIQT